MEEIPVMTECEFIGGPVCGLAAMVPDTKMSCAIMSLSRTVETIKSCGVRVRQYPRYKRINERRFTFAGYR